MGYLYPTGWLRAAAASIALAWMATDSLPARGQIQFGDSSEFQLSSNIKLDEADAAARRNLVQIEAHLANEQWDDAVEGLRRVMDRQGQRVIALATAEKRDKTDKHSARRFRRSVSLRDYCHMRIATLPPEALRLYRQRVDLPRGEVERAIAARDRRLLESIVADSFCSTWGDEALFALGEMALERGHYAAARAYWEQIVGPAHWEKIFKVFVETDVEEIPEDQHAVFYFLVDRIGAHQPAIGRENSDAPAPIRWLRYPDTNLDLGEVLARLVLVSIREGSIDRARFELSALRALHPKAKGKIGGREVAYATWLDEQLKATPSGREGRTSDNWLTFGGSNRRTTVARQSIRLSGQSVGHTLPGPWKASRSSQNTSHRAGRWPADDPDALLCYHPIIVGDLVLVNSQEKIFAFNARTGRPPAWAADDGRIYPPSSVKDGDIPKEPFDSNDVVLGAHRFTMTVHGHLLFARMGPPQTSRPVGAQPSYFRPGYLLCLDLAAEGRLVWSLKPESSAWAFEGSPVTDATHIYVAMRRSGVRPQAHVACFDIASRRQRWRQKICSADTPARGGEEITHNLLTLHEETIYYNTNLGAVAALSTRDGHVKWANVYPRAKVNLNEPPTHFYRDLTPCVFYRSVLIVAPSDHSGLFGLDAATGQLVWQSRGLSDPVHLLGTADGKLVASGKGIFLLDAMTGDFERFWPSRNHPDPPGFGRGLIAGNLVFRPTREQIEVLDLRSLTLAGRQPISLVGKAAGGNLVAAGGLVVIAAADKLYIFGGGAALAPKDEPDRKETK